MATVTRKTSGAANVQFGLTGVTFTGTIPQSYDDNLNSQISETPDATGATVAAAFYDNKRDITVEGLYNSASALTAKPGDAVTINGFAAFVKSLQCKQAATDWYKVTLVATFYADNTLV